jgi:hypothetical protein
LIVILAIVDLRFMRVPVSSFECRVFTDTSLTRVLNPRQAFSEVIE